MKNFMEDFFINTIATIDAGFLFVNSYLYTGKKLSKHTLAILQTRLL